MPAPTDNTPDHHELTREDAAVFGAKAHANARLFARRVLAMPEVSGLTIEPDKARMRLGYEAGHGQRQTVLNRLADAIQGSDVPLTEDELPDWPEDETVRWVRGGGQLTRMDIDAAVPGRLLLTHPWLQGPDHALRRHLDKPLRSLAGVRGVSIEAAEGCLKVLYSPARVTPERIIRVIETAFR